MMPLSPRVFVLPVRLRAGIQETKVRGGFESTFPKKFVIPWLVIGFFRRLHLVGFVVVGLLHGAASARWLTCDRSVQSRQDMTQGE